jgi:hypothetical protein
LEPRARDCGAARRDPGELPRRFISKCSGVTPGGKQALQCLQKKVAALSPGYKTAVSATLPATSAGH